MRLTHKSRKLRYHRESPTGASDKWNPDPGPVHGEHGWFIDPPGVISWSPFPVRCITATDTLASRQSPYICSLACGLRLRAVWKAKRLPLKLQAPTTTKTENQK